MRLNKINIGLVTIGGFLLYKGADMYIQTNGLTWQAVLYFGIVLTLGGLYLKK